MKILIGIDDINSLQGWGHLEDLKYPIALNKKYGAKFTLFTPAYYHFLADLRNNKSWFQEIDSLGFIEWAAHGCFHNTTTRNDECEFAELTEGQAEFRIKHILEIWDYLGAHPKVWKNPGWLCTQGAANAISRNFNLVHSHGIHDSNIIWSTNTVTGHIGIDKQDRFIEPLKIFQSHINGPNDNNWTEENYLNLCTLFDHYLRYTELEFIKFEDLLNG